MKKVNFSVFRPMLSCLFAVLLAACGETEKPLSHEEIIRADLAEILELQGLSCKEVVKFEASDRLDYKVVCDSGNQYRIHVSEEGHVNIDQRPD
jgi:hypothetical protein